MKNIKRLRRNIRFILNSHNIFDAAIHHNGGREVVVSMPLTAETSVLLNEINKNKSSSIRSRVRGNGLEIKAQSLNHLKTFFRRNLTFGAAEPVLD